MPDTKWLYCFCCRSSHLHNLVKDNQGNLSWECPNCNMKRKETFDDAPPLHTYPEDKTSCHPKA